MSNTRYDRALGATYINGLWEAVEKADKNAKDIVAKGYIAKGYKCNVLETGSVQAAITNFTQWLAVHFSKVGIRCNAIAPGFFVTKQNEKMLYNEDGTPTVRTGKILVGTPMGRFGEVEELIGSVLFLSCDEASGFVNGCCIPVDGAFAPYSGV